MNQQTFEGDLAEDLAEPTRVASGTELHWLESGMTISTSEPDSFSPISIDLPRGTVLVVTDKLRANATDRFGACWLDLADDEAAQIEKWGRRMFARGPWPTGEPILRPGSVEALVERDRRRAKVTRHFEGDDLLRELRAIDKELGTPATVVELGKYAAGF